VFVFVAQTQLVDEIWNEYTLLSPVNGLAVAEPPVSTEFVPGVAASEATEFFMFFSCELSERGAPDGFFGSIARNDVIEKGPVRMASVSQVYYILRDDLLCHFKVAMD